MIGAIILRVGLFTLAFCSPSATSLCISSWVILGLGSIAARAKSAAFRGGPTFVSKHIGTF